MVSLYRQKELLKKDILRKRALLEKELQCEIQVVIFRKYQKHFVLFYFSCKCRKRLLKSWQPVRNWNAPNKTKSVLVAVKGSPQRLQPHTLCLQCRVNRLDVIERDRNTRRRIRRHRRAVMDQVIGLESNGRSCIVYVGRRMMKPSSMSVAICVIIGSTATVSELLKRVARL